MKSRNITKIIVHCSAGSQKNSAAEIVNYHLRSRKAGGRGWRAPGYHYIIEADGRIVRTWPEESVSNGVRGHNSDSINVCYVGGVDLTRSNHPPVDNRTPQQKASLLSLLKDLRLRYPRARIYGHRDFAPKACPSFDAGTEYSAI